MTQTHMSHTRTWMEGTREAKATTARQGKAQTAPVNITRMRATQHTCHPAARSGDHPDPCHAPGSLESTIPWRAARVSNPQCSQGTMSTWHTQSPSAQHHTKQPQVDTLTTNTQLRLYPGTYTHSAPYLVDPAGAYVPCRHMAVQLGAVLPGTTPNRPAGQGLHPLAFPKVPAGHGCSSSSSSSSSNSHPQAHKRDGQPHNNKSYPTESDNAPCSWCCQHHSRCLDCRHQSTLRWSGPQWTQTVWGRRAVSRPAHDTGGGHRGGVGRVGAHWK